MPADNLQIARTQNDQLVTEGFKLLADGRQDEAFLVAENALASDPGHVQALSLKGDVLERRGELAEAFLCYEKVVELTPDSALDRIKLDHVRRMLATNLEPAKPNRRVALGAAIAATSLIACIGAGVTIVMSNRSSEPKLVTDGTSVAQNFPSTGTGVSNGVPQAIPRSREDFDRMMNEAARQSPAPTSPASPRREAPVLPSAETNGGESEVSGVIRPMPVNVTPINPSPGNTLPNTQPQPTRPSVDPDPTPDQGTTQTPTQPERANPGTVDIRPSQGGNTRVGGSETIPESGNALSDTESRARQFFNAGEYAKAAAQYERALSMGANPARTNQRLGQCYERLGKRAEAIRAYENAARYVTAQLQSSPESDTLKASLEAINQALANLRG